MGPTGGRRGDSCGIARHRVSQTSSDAHKSRSPRSCGSVPSTTSSSTPQITFVLWTFALCSPHCIALWPSFPTIAAAVGEVVGVLRSTTPMLRPLAPLLFRRFAISDCGCLGLPHSFGIASSFGFAHGIHFFPFVIILLIRGVGQLVDLHGFSNYGASAPHSR